MVAAINILSKACVSRLGSVSNQENTLKEGGRGGEAAESKSCLIATLVSCIQYVNWNSINNWHPRLYIYVCMYIVYAEKQELSKSSL